MTDLWELERRFWMEGSKAYGDLLDADCLIATTLLGVIQGEDALNVFGSAPPHTNLDFQNAVLVSDGAVAVLGYRVSLARGSGEPHVFLCTSSWIDRDEGWRMVQHHQTTVAVPPEPEPSAT